MKITVKGLSDKAWEERDYRQMMSIQVDGKGKFFAMDGESEDANLNRDFRQCWDIPELMQLAYEAGKRGEPFEIERVEVDDPMEIH